MKRSELFLSALRLPVDFLAIVTAFFVAKILRLHPTLLAQFQNPADLAVDLSGFSKFVALASLGLIVIFALNGLYRMRASGRLSRELSKIFYLSAAWLLLLVAYFFFRREFYFSRLALVYTGILTVLFVSAGRILIRLIQKLLWRLNIDRTRVLIIGTNSNSLALGENLKKNRRYKFLGFLEVGTIHHEFPHKPIGTLIEFEKIVQEKKIEEIILASRKLKNSEMRDILAFCRTKHIDFSFVPDLLEVPRKNIEFSTIQSVPLITLKPTPLEGWGRIIKRSFDLIVATLTILITSPLWLITAIAIKLDSPGPVFFSQKDNGQPVLRIGRHEKPFRFIKFRSMREKSDSLRYSKELAEKNTRAGTPLVKIENDPRITRVGKFIRRYSIDELPNLFSVLIGKMSLVGPRAHLPEEVEKYRPHHKRVLEIKPGVTGMAQISGRSDLNFEQEVKLDTWYIENWSLWLDVKILLKTIGVVLFPRHRE